MITSKMNIKKGDTYLYVGSFSQFYSGDQDQLEIIAKQDFLEKMINTLPAEVFNSNNSLETL